ncbi:MAG: hypothetical protein IPK96_09630 [Flammeovirgaceae bacterium]|nr:hypothetical protein [Flammeovirgaceae bacterium]
MGKKSGEWKYFYPNGNRNAIEQYTRGMLDGKILYFYPNDTLQGKETWVQGRLTDSAWYYHKNGALLRKGLYKASEYDGTWFTIFKMVRWNV